MVGPAYSYKSTRWGLKKRAKCPTHGTRSKFYLMIEAKNILVVFSGFSHGLKCHFFFGLVNTRHFKIGFKTWGFNTVVSIFVLYTTKTIL